MQFTTKVDIQKPQFLIEPTDEMLFVGSCFADNMGQRFADNCFRVVRNPYGVMYNPVSILHSVERWQQGMPNADGIRKKSNPDIAFLTLGTNHVYRLKETGEIVDNCQKRPQKLFNEEELSIEQCADALQKAVNILCNDNPEIKIVITVSPIRYAKYGFHGSQLSKATLLLAADALTKSNGNVYYFPAYEIVNDELRDYRFYAADMLHPSPQAVDYIWERLQETLFSKASLQFIAEWQPIRDALNHRPFNSESPQYKNFLEKTNQQLALFQEKYGIKQQE
ncbi:MAG: GSCFA domain-containing protein [Prevotella sp.]|nr:GSCFA domain-containing protein [Prevotella sp.]